MNSKGLLVSPTHPGTRTRHCPHGVRDWGRGHKLLPGLKTAAGLFFYGGVWHHWGVWSSKLCQQFLLGEQLEVLLSLPVFPTGAAEKVTVAVGCEKGKWRTWTVCPWGEHHIQHVCNSPSASPPQHLLLLLLPLLRDVSWSCWQQWWAQHRDNRGEGTAAATAGPYICLDPRTAVWPREIIAGNERHVWEFFTIWKVLDSSQQERKVYAVASRDDDFIWKITFVELTGHLLQTWLSDEARRLYRHYMVDPSLTAFRL